LTETALALAAAIRRRQISAVDVTEAALSRIAAHNPKVNAFTTVTAEAARRDAVAVDTALASGQTLGPLAGVPFAAKNLFDITGVVTIAGSVIEQRRAPATQDAFGVARLRAAGAICLGALNMDEYAYGFTTENSHYGPARNPHDVTRTAGGSSGGSGAAVAAGLVPITLGTDTNGSIRVPASVDGIFGLKPTYGRLSRAGAVLFIPSLDHIGPFARTVADLAAAYDALLGHDPADPAQADRPLEPVSGALDRGLDGLRIARLGGHFAKLGLPEAYRAVDTVADALDVSAEVDLPGAASARSAAYLITAAEGAQLRLPDLRTQPERFEPHSVDRLLAGGLIPAQWVLHAQRLRAMFRAEVAALFAHWDILIAPATPSCATVLGQDVLEVDGVSLPLRPSFGMYTQPISCVGLPVLAVPAAKQGLPIGVQLIGAPWTEAKLFRAAAVLEAQGVCISRVAAGFG